MGKWPFFLITFGLLVALGITISTMERQVIINNWDKKRCEFPIMAAGMFFKPVSDPRSGSQFSKDNFSFCMKTHVDNFMNILMTPINTVFGKQVGVATSGIDTINSIRGMTATMYAAFSKMLEGFFKKFNSSIFQMNRIVQHLRTAMDRLGAMVLAILFAGISAFRGMINAIQFVMKVILIICGILIAIMIIIFFILFPFVPMVLATLGAIVTTVAVISVAVVGTMAGTAAADMAGSICFSKNTNLMSNGPKNVSEVKLGDTLDNCGEITAIIETTGKDVQLFDLEGIEVSGSHLVESGGKYIPVANDPRSKKIETRSDILYCFNTTSNKIPVYTPEKTIIFRDWEEISEDDKKGQYLWNYMILKTLNKSANYTKWKDSMSSSNIPLMNRKVKTIKGFINISEIKVLDKVLDRDGKEQTVIGVVRGFTNGLPNGSPNGMANGLSEWNTELYEYKDGIWVKGKNTLDISSKRIEGRTLITETGEFIILDEVEKLVRDFTEIGCDSIAETYPFVASRLNPE